jgi:outer membrane protein OmpA-like peptidoglycan-associated protein
MRKVLFLILLTTTAMAQSQVSYPNRPRYPDGLLALRAGGGFTKYLGEFVDNNVGDYYAFSGCYSLLPELSIGIDANAGKSIYNRRMRRSTGDAYAIQFGDENLMIRTTTFSSFNFLFYLNLFPRQYFNAYLVAGAGVTFFQPQDFAENKAWYRPKTENLASLTIPVGIGAEYFVFRNMSINAELRNHFMFTDQFDAFASSEITAQYRLEKGITVADNGLTEGSDNYSLLSVGMKLYMFENRDIDGDLLQNSEEEALGTNPYDIDTDGDGLTDYEESRVIHSNPLAKDSDADGLNDYVEYNKYHTSPSDVDTDHDGVNDSDEILVYKTNPLEADTDGDGLTDLEEKNIGTNPRDVDTDKDYLNDYAEAKIRLTNPLVPDTDGDGLTDYEEVTTYLTNPLISDTDGDGLSDYAEITVYKTSPVKRDTDGDALDDGNEVMAIGTNPLKRDTDDDGVLDNLDKCPLLAETYNGVADSDGCPDLDGSGKSTYPLARVVARPEYKSISKTDTLVQIDTVYIREGGLLTLFGVNFEVDKDIIRPESYAILESNLQLFKQYPEMSVEIRGHTDSDGSEEHNKELSFRRAQSIREYYVQHGVAPHRLTVQGFGASSPVASNTTNVGKARNRRIEFYISKRGDRMPDSGNSFTGEQLLMQEK